MRMILRTMDLPGKSAALYRPRKSPIATCDMAVMLPVKFSSKWLK